MASAQRHGELRREPVLSGRPATPPPPSGESEEEGGDAEGDASPAPAPQTNDIPTANGIPEADGSASGQSAKQTGVSFVGQWRIDTEIVSGSLSSLEYCWRGILPQPQVIKTPRGFLPHWTTRSSRGVANTKPRLAVV